MGYMGFGMQKWIYSMRPRRPFTKGRKAGYDTISGISEHHFSVPPDKSKWRIPIWIFAIIGIIILIVTILNLVGVFSEQERDRIINDLADKKEMEGEFKSFYNSAMAYYESGQWDNARSEFEFALRLKNNDKSSLRYYLACLIRMSENDPKLLNLTQKKIDSISILYPEDAELNKLRIEFYLHAGDTLNAIKVLNKIKE